MRKRIAVLGFLVLGAAIPARAGGPVGPDWISIHLTAGSTGATGVGIAISAHAVTVGSDTQLIGFGFGGAVFPGGCNLVFALGGGRTRVTTTRTIGGADVTLVDAPSGGERDLGVSTGFGGMWAPGATLAYIVYVSGMQFSSTDIRTSAASGSVTATIAAQGTGTRLLRAADPGDEGTAVGAGPVGAGASTHTEVMAAGIAGGWNGFTFCISCTGTWKAPDLEAPRAWSYSSAIVFGSGACGFGGPAGEWRFTWRGAGYNRPAFLPEGEAVYGAFAPIGDDWIYFR